MKENKKMYEIRIESKARKIIKKLPKKLQEIIDKEIGKIKENPIIGKVKTGDLLGIRVHKFKFFTLQILIAYEIDEKKNQIIIYLIGPHENFYRDLKKYLKS